jgi:hypothetical protein
VSILTLAGTFPSNWGNLTSLTSLDLSGNTLSSTFPSSITGLSALQYVSPSCRTCVCAHRAVTSVGRPVQLAHYGVCGHEGFASYFWLCPPPPSRAPPSHPPPVLQDPKLDIELHLCAANVCCWASLPPVRECSLLCNVSVRAFVFCLTFVCSVGRACSVRLLMMYLPSPLPSL